MNEISLLINLIIFNLVIFFFWYLALFRSFQVIHINYIFTDNVLILCLSCNVHWGKADDRNPKMADVESGKNLFCRLNCFYNVF